MKTLTRPMFNMGGPIKQGIMHGIREPKKHGGKMLLAGQHPQQFKDAGGREQHAWPLLYYGAQALRAVPTIYRGAKAARMFTPWKQNLGKWGRFKDMFLPSSRFKNVAAQKGKDPSAAFIKGDPSAFAGSVGTPASKLGFWRSMRDPSRLGAAIGENPFTAFGVASLAPQAGYAGYKAAKAAPGAIWEGAKRYADLVIPGDQSSWYTPKDPPVGVPLNPNLQANVAAAKKLSTEKKNEFALKQREDRVQKYLKMMGYDRAKKTAIADALIDASKIVGDRGSLDPKNITQELINPIIQATSKRLDKPDQIREAVGLMATKAEIEKDLEDPTVKALRMEQYKKLKGGFEKDIGDLLLSTKGTRVDKQTLEQFTRVKANEYGLPFTKITDEVKDTATGATEEEKIQSIVGDDGIYMIGDAIIKVTGGVPKHIV